MLESLHDLSQAAERGKQMIKKLLAFSRREALALRLVDPAAHARETVGTLRRLLPSTVTVGLTTDDGVPPISADPGALEQMLVNLATNARDAMPQGGRLEVAVQRVAVSEPQHLIFRELPPGEYVCLAVRDTGVGMEDETLRRVFEPLYTTKPEGKGTGLGMAMVLSLAEQQHGFVNVISAPGQGTTVELFFPALRGAVDVAPARAPQAAEVRGGKETIVVADDDVAVRRVVLRALSRAGYAVLPVHDGLQALEACRAHGAEIALVISDMTMPRMTGAELYRALRGEGSAVKFLFSSGYERKDGDEATDPRARSVPKPWTVEELLRAVRELLDA